MYININMIQKMDDVIVYHIECQFVALLDIRMLFGLIYLHA